MGYIELNEELKHHEFLEFFIMSKYDPDDLITKQKMLLAWDACAKLFRASEVGVQPGVVPKTCGQCKYYAKKISYCAKYDCNRVDTQAQPDYCKNDWFEYESK